MPDVHGRNVLRNHLKRYDIALDDVRD